MRRLCAIAFALVLVAGAAGTERVDIRLDEGWRTAEAANPARFPGFQRVSFDDGAWKTVEVPQNWDEYGGDHLLLNGDLHGYAWYRRWFELPAGARNRRVFLYFEGVGTYATVWVNGREVGRHAGGRTTFTLDITDAARFDGANLVAVCAAEPYGIRDVPWIAGGDAPIPGFSEGTQPLGIFRPVHVVITDPVRVEPFGVHVWNDADATAGAAVVHVGTEIRNYGPVPAVLLLKTRILDRTGRIVAEMDRRISVAPGATIESRQDTRTLAGVRLWSLDDPYLYTADTALLDAAAGRDPVRDHVRTAFGIRTIRWPSGPADPERRFLLNGRPVFINGVAEYEHNLGASHAFSDNEVRARALEIRAAGFNAFRDAHQPHNLRYQQYWDRWGLLWWPQFAAHIWFDTPAFRANFQALLRDWVKERRNSPSLVLWGLENESVLPPDFARQCCAIIRELDPTATIQRKITTCNGGRGADWNVPQDWSGTYGGNPADYAADLRRDGLVGEYGAWRSIDYHSEGGFRRDGPLTEDRMAGLLELKLRLAESVRNDCCGQFMWLFQTHENPGRAFGPLGQQRADGIRLIDQVGPANNKGLLTLWGEPTDAYYLYRSNYVSGRKDPMVVIVSHTWPDRWTRPGRKRGIVVYSNCDAVELFNDYRARPLGLRRRGPIGTHFQWDDVDIETNVLYAEGYVHGRLAATDSIVLDRLPPAPHLAELNGRVLDLTRSKPGWNYLYRVNCGGPDYRDLHGQLWSADRDDATGLPWGCRSWAADYPNVPPDLGSQRETHDPIVGTRDGPLFQTFRYGRDRLRYRFSVPQGRYRVELYFIEPWYGRGGAQDCSGWRLFDVAVNGVTALHDIDLWREAGYCQAVKKVVYATVRSGRLIVSFPRVDAGQAVISAIAVAAADPGARPEIVAPGERLPAPPDWDRLGPPLRPAPGAAAIATGAVVYSVRTARRSHGVHLRDQAGPAARDFATVEPGTAGYVEWKISLGVGGTHAIVLRYACASPVMARLLITADDGSPVDARPLFLPATGPDHRWSTFPVPRGENLNAGRYRVRITMADPAAAIAIAALMVN